MSLRLFILTITCLLLNFSVSKGTICTSVRAGSYGATNVWDCGAVPSLSGSDTIIVKHAITATWKNISGNTVMIIDSGGSWTDIGGATVSTSAQVFVSGTMTSASTMTLSGGTVTVENGGVLNTQSTSSINLSGTVLNVNSGGSVTTAGNVDISGTSVLNIHSAASVTTSGYLQSEWSNNQINLDAGGTINAASMTIFGSSSTPVHTLDGTINLTGDFTANSPRHTIINGTINATNFVATSSAPILTGTPAGMNLSGNFEVDGGTMDFSTPAGDTIKVGGNLTTSGASTLSIANPIQVSGSMNIVGGPATFNGEVKVSGNLDKANANPLVFNGRGIISGDAALGGGQSVTIGNGALFQASNIDIENGVTVNDSGYMQAVNTLTIGNGTGSNYIQGNGNLAWNISGSGNSEPVSDGTGSSWIVCNSTKYYGTGSYNGTTQLYPPNNPLDLSTCGAGTLPVSFISFTGSCYNNLVLLKWSTASESNSERFIIERRDASSHSWKTIGTVKGSGNSDRYKSYSFYDNQTSSGSGHYYRIKEVDFDGNASLSHVIYVKSTGKNNYKIYPQPLLQGTLLHVDFPQPVSWSVFSIEGTELGFGNFEFEGEQASIDFSGNPLKPGIYILRIVTISGVFQEKIIIAAH